MDFYNRIGPAALGNRLRRLGDHLAEEAVRVYALYGVELQPRWFPVVFVLAERGEESVTEIADEIGHSHVSVSQIVAEMLKTGFARRKKQKADGRKSLVSLSEKGRAAAAALRVPFQDVAQVVADIQKQSGADLWSALAGCEQELARESLFERMQRRKTQREETRIRIVGYSPTYAAAFKELNEEWIRTHFEIEAADSLSLDNPTEYILGPGGHILIALLADEPIGTCALVPKDAQSFELAKMAVSPKARGRGTGWLIAQAALQWAREAGAKRIFLESNTRLEPAIRLYRKLGFKEIKGGVSRYQRCNIQMELNLE